MNIRKIRNSLAIIVTLVIIAIGPLRVFAVEQNILPVENGEQTADEKESGEGEDNYQSTEAIGSILLPTDTVEENIISVDLPTVKEDEDSPFDFIIDPQNLLFKTDAAVFGGGVVEEGANLLFNNRTEGGVDFSKYSDRLGVTNRSTVPVMVTISAKITDADDLQIVQDKDFAEDNLPYVYLALVDDRGNEQPISKDSEVSINVKMEKAPKNAYVYTFDPETGKYEYGLSVPSEDIVFDTYSFGLTGECSSNADWSNVAVHPKITVTWDVEPILMEQESEEEDEQRIEESQLTIEQSEDVADEEISSEDDGR